MEYKLTLFDLKKGKDYFIQLTPDFINVKRNGIFIWESIIDYNGTYTFVHLTVEKRQIVYEFINTTYILHLSYNLNKTKFYDYFSYINEFIDCSISESTSEYVLK